MLMRDSFYLMFFENYRLWMVVEDALPKSA